MRRAMDDYLLLLFAIYCTVTGFELGHNHTSIWGVLIFLVVGTVFMQTAYLVGVWITDKG